MLGVPTFLLCMFCLLDFGGDGIKMKLWSRSYPKLSMPCNDATWVATWFVECTRGPVFGGGGGAAVAYSAYSSIERTPRSN